MLLGKKTEGKLVIIMVIFFQMRISDFEKKKKYFLRLSTLKNRFKLSKILATDIVRKF